jgi:hypothetical protein
MSANFCASRSRLVNTQIMNQNLQNLLTKALRALALQEELHSLLSKQQVSFDTGEARSITETTDYAMKSSDFAIFADATGGPIHITLPKTSNRGTIIFIQKVDDSNNPVYVESGERERTNGTPRLKATTRCEGWILVADGLKTWNILSRSGSAHSETGRKTRAGE